MAPRLHETKHFTGSRRSELMVSVRRRGKRKEVVDTAAKGMLGVGAALPQDLRRKSPALEFHSHVKSQTSTAGS